jgi:hypothetical protein
MSKQSKLEYTDDAVDDDESELIVETPPVAPVKPAKEKKARTDAQRAVTNKMRDKLAERRRDLVVIKAEAKETALLQQNEMKALIKEKLLTKQQKTKADEKLKKLIQDQSESESEEEVIIKPKKIKKQKPVKQESESEEEEVVVVKKQRQPIKKPTNFIQSQRQPVIKDERPTIRFV